jgi:hypothetical protein
MRKNLAKWVYSAACLTVLGLGAVSSARANLPLCCVTFGTTCKCCVACANGCEGACGTGGCVVHCI